jgi:hypothetical protein
MDGFWAGVLDFNSEAASIVGHRTGKVLYMGVKNKYCMICARASHKNIRSSSQY